jgi:hypothetical protein
MRRVSLSRPDLKRDPDDPPGFRCSVWRFGESLGAEQVGTTLYEIPPGQAVCPYHYENAEEEWLLVLDGNPTLREPDGENRLDPMDCRVLSAWPGRCAPGSQRHGRDGSCAHVGREPLPRGVDLPRQQQDRRLTRPGGDGRLYRLGTEVDYYDGESNQR